MITVSINNQVSRDFQQGIQDYIDVSGKEAQYAVEKQMKKVLVGAKGVTGLVQLFKKDAPDAARIRRETDKHNFLWTTGWDGTKRKLIRAPKGSQIRKNIIKGRIRGKFFLSGSFNFRFWRPENTLQQPRLRTKSQTLHPKAGRNRKQIKDSRLHVSNRGGFSPNAKYQSQVEGVVIHEGKRKYVAIATANALHDINVYIVNKFQRNFQKRFL